MQVIISARHTTLPDHVRDHIQEQFQRLSRFEPRASRTEVTVREESGSCVIEAVVSIDGDASVHGTAEAEMFRSATDRLIDKLATQLKKVRSRRTDHRTTLPEVYREPDDLDA